MSNKNIVYHDHLVTKEQRVSIKNQKPCILWFTGLSGSGKSTIANAVEAKLNNMGKHTYLLDGDNIRLGLNKDLGFSNTNRVENIRRVGEITKLFVDSGIIVLSAFISPFKNDRDRVRNLVNKDEFIEIFIDTPLKICENRDPKGLYKKTRKGKITNFTGISSDYEVPLNAEITIKTDTSSIQDSVIQIIEYITAKGYLLSNT